MIYNTTHYSSNLYKRLNQHLFWSTQFKMSLLAVLPILVMAIALYFMGENVIFFVSLGLIGVLLISTFMLLFFENTSISNASRKYPEKKLYYEFNGKDFKVIVRTEDTKTEEVITYNEIKRVKTNKKYMFIYLSKKDLYVVDKRGFETLDDYRGIHDLFKDRFLV
ncbi:YcxB family protein [Paracholeplasma brassicae]|nr:YcxB family protein [Paracholeplasma brassicae]